MFIRCFFGFRNYNGKCNEVAATLELMHHPERIDLEQTKSLHLFDIILIRVMCPGTSRNKANDDKTILGESSTPIDRILKDFAL